MSDEPAPNERGLLLRRIAHEVLSPTGVAWGALDELESAGQPDEMKPLLAMGRRALSRLRRLARRLSMTAELEGGKPRLERVASDLGEVLARAVEESRVIDGRRQVEITVDQVPHVEVSADARWLEVAFAELASNAIRFARSRAHVRAVCEDGKLEVTFEDDGDGFGDADPRELADRYAARPQVRGLGLSLALAYDVAEAHGGTLVVCESSLPAKAKKGACMRFSIPVMDATENV